MREKKDLRLFFALWPDQAVREAIADRLSHIGLKDGRQVPGYNWHLTLHFIGNTTIDEKHCLDRQANKVGEKPFELILDRTGFFKKPKVFWLGSHHVPGRLYELQENLGKEISCCDYQPETRPYSPHVTVARKVSKEPPVMSIEPIKWFIDQFALVESVSVPQGVRYDVVESYELDNSC